MEIQTKPAPHAPSKSASAYQSVPALHRVHDWPDDARRAYDAVLQPALQKLAAAPAHGLLLVACECAERLGESDAHDWAVQRLMQSEAQGAERAQALLMHAQHAMRKGNLPDAERSYREAAIGFDAAQQPRNWAIARDGLADILQARGELDEALALQQQRLPVAERLWDQNSIAHIRYSMARIRLERKDHERGGMQAIADDLGLAYAISCKLGQPDAVGEVGLVWAQVLAMCGYKVEALQVLDQAAAAFRKLGRQSGVAQVLAIRAAIAGENTEPA